MLLLIIVLIFGVKPFTEFTKMWVLGSFCYQFFKVLTFPPDNVLHKYRNTDTMLMKLFRGRQNLVGNILKSKLHHYVTFKHPENLHFWDGHNLQTRIIWEK